MRAIAKYFGGTLIAAVLISACLAHFVRAIGTNGAQFDGFGRELIRSPWFMRMVFGQEKLWAGWLWWTGDIVIFFGGIALGAAIVNFGLSDKKKSD